MQDMLVHLRQFCQNEINSVLKTSDDVEKAKQLLLDYDLPLHHDYTKNWDNLIAVYYTCLNLCFQPDAHILDVAATHESAYLPGLRVLGFTDLCSINLGLAEQQEIDGITYVPGDITATPFDDHSFDFIACLSVIEHGIDLPKFFEESNRILKSGGHLLISTDYWPDSIDTGGRVAFDVPVKIFDQYDVLNMVGSAADHGLFLFNDRVDLAAQDRVVNWIGLDYTFINLLFHKK